MIIPGIPNEPMQRLTLRDGRILSYIEYGDPKGIPLLFFHGTPGTHYLIKMAKPGAVRQGFRLIAPDRPGLGDSSDQPGRELHHYPDDIKQLLAHMGLEKVGVAAISGGAPYAFQCAHDLPEQIKYVASLSGWVSYGREGMDAIRIDPFFRTLNWVRQKIHCLFPLFAKAARSQVKKRLRKLYKHIEKKLPPSDRAALQEESVRTIFLGDLQNAFKQDWKGVSRDSELQFATPNFLFENIRQPVLLLHGTADTVVPFGCVEYMRARLPNIAGFMRIEDGGHLCAVTEQDAIYVLLKALEH